MLSAPKNLVNSLSGHCKSDMLVPVFQRLGNPSAYRGGLLSGGAAAYDTGTPKLSIRAFLAGYLREQNACVLLLQAESKLILYADVC